MACKETHMHKSIRTLAIATALGAICVQAAATLPVNPPPDTTPPTGSEPNCDGAAASIGVIWPPNHSMVAITIVGVVDPYGLPFNVAITDIRQDEAVDATGSGNTAPDGSGIGTDTAMVRAERAGPGTGRLYFISFLATNSMGLQCSGMVQASVPHDQGQGFTPVDTGLRVDSTMAAN